MKAPFLTFRELDEGHLQYYVLQKDFPHYLGCISSHPVNSTICQVPIPGYNMWVVFDGCLRGKMIPNYQDVINEIQIIVQNMAIWFLTERIQAEPKKFKKWKYDPSPQTSS